MLSEMVDHVVGIDPDRDRVTAVLVDAKTRAELAEATFPTTPGGYAELIDWADADSVPEARVWSIEGAGSYGAGLCATLQTAGEWVVEFDHPETRAAKDGAKTDGLDAARADRELLGRAKLTQPRARGTREGIRALLVARRSAKQARVAEINALKALVVTAPVALREQLRDFTTTNLVNSSRRLRLTDGLCRQHRRRHPGTKELMYRLGHSSHQAALRYQHATRDRDRSIADAINEVIGADGQSGAAASRPRLHGASGTQG